MFTRFFDLYSGGSSKEDFDTMYVELSQGDAEDWFKGKYGRDPRNITCQCCGLDYSIWEVGDEPDMEDADLIIRKEDL